MNKRNYQKELEGILADLEKKELKYGQRTADQGVSGRKPPRLFLHSCCAPCSSYVMEYLSPYFQITVFYYNPNISMEEEYRKRVSEQKRLIAAYNAEGGRYPIEIIEGDYRPEVFFETTKGLEDCPEGKERCFACYELRLRETARRAAEGGYDYFGTTLTISPLKNAEKLNEIGGALSVEYGVAYLSSDFKKRGGYQRSVELSGKYDLYRQDYCGCVYSKAERERSRRKI